MRSEAKEPTQSVSGAVENRPAAKYRLQLLNNAVRSEGTRLRGDRVKTDKPVADARPNAAWVARTRCTGPRGRLSGDWR